MGEEGAGRLLLTCLPWAGQGAGYLRTLAVAQGAAERCSWRALEEEQVGLEVPLGPGAGVVVPRRSCGDREDYYSVDSACWDLNGPENNTN